MSQSEPNARLHRAESVSPDARVRHYDELSDRAQQAVFGVAGDAPATVSAPDLNDGDVVVFTNYYRVRR